MLTQAELKKYLHYCPDTGIFRWVVARNKIKAGTVAGTLRPDGYVSVVLFRKRYLAHRLAFLFMLGRFPQELADHRDLIKHNNAWVNLRDATYSQNRMNSGLAPVNTSGFTGVSLHGKRWRARINIGRKEIYLGTYDSAELAHEARMARLPEFHGEFAYAVK